MSRMASPSGRICAKVGWTVGKKKKERKKRHDQHHQAIHDWIMSRKMMEDGEVEQHVLPNSQDWHVPDTNCACFPIRLGPSPQGITVWFHKAFIH